MAKKEKEKKAPSQAEVKLKRLLAKAFPTLAKVSGSTAAELDETKPKLPLVNMLPPSLVIEVRKRAMTRGFAALAALMALVVGGVWFAQGTEIQVATVEVETREFETQLVKQEVDRLKPIGAYFDQLQQRLNIAAQVYMEQADYATILAGIRGSAPEGVVITEVSIEFISPLAPEAPTCGTDTSPFLDQTARPLGCISFTGVARDTVLLTEFIRNVESVEAIQYPFIAPGQPSATGEITFTGTAAISAAASVAEAAAELVDVSEIDGLTPVNEEDLQAPGDPVE